MDYSEVFIRGSVSSKPSIIEKPTVSFGILPVVIVKRWKGSGGKEETKSTYQKVFVFGERYREVESFHEGDEVVVRGELGAMKQTTKGGEEYYVTSITVSDTKGDFSRISTDITRAKKEAESFTNDEWEIPF